MKTYIGIDLGGTNVRVAKVSEDGEVLVEVKSPSFASEGPAKVLDNMIELIKSIPDYKSCSGIGIGVPGPVDVIHGEMVIATNLPGFEHYPLTNTIEYAVNLSTFLDNDANVAGLAEALVGAGKNKPIVYYITHSTGIGGALIINGKLVSGRHGYAGEIANIVIDRDRKKINYLNAGAVENEASGVALGRIGKERLGDKVESAKDVFALARKGNHTALDIIDRMSYDFAMMCANIAHVCDPDIFVIGGGVSSASDLYLDKVKEYYKNLVHVGMRDVDFVLAELDEPGVIGAAMLPLSNGV